MIGLESYYSVCSTTGQIPIRDIPRNQEVICGQFNFLQNKINDAKKAHDAKLVSNKLICMIDVKFQKVSQ